jgi:uncharacterized protein YegL
MIDNHNLPGDGSIVMPFYVMCDISAASRPELAALKNEVDRLRTAIVSDAIPDDVVFVSISTFSARAHLLMPLGPIRNYSITDFPAKDQASSAHYGNAFSELADRLEKDYASLRGTTWKVYRPCVYFLASTEPSDTNWHETFQSTLTESAMKPRRAPYPIFVPFGFGRASMSVLSRLSYPEDISKFYQSTSAVIEDAIEGILDIIKTSVIQSSTRSITAGRAEHVLPEPSLGTEIVCPASPRGLRP